MWVCAQECGIEHPGVEAQVIVSYLTWMPGTELWSSGRAMCALCKREDLNANLKHPCK